MQEYGLVGNIGKDFLEEGNVDGTCAWKGMQGLLGSTYRDGLCVGIC